jgi:hypothetical protein
LALIFFAGILKRPRLPSGFNPVNSHTVFHLVCPIRFISCLIEWQHTMLGEHLPVGKLGKQRGRPVGNPVQLMQPHHYDRADGNDGQQDDQKHLHPLPPFKSRQTGEQ